MIWASANLSRIAVMMLRLLRQYLCRLESIISLAFIWIIWLYVRWVTERYRPLFGGKQLEYVAINDLQETKGFLDIGLANLKKTEDVLHDEVYRFSRGDVGFYAIRGLRQSMEDRMRIVEDPEHSGYSMYGIYDGHGGQLVSEQVIQMDTSIINTAGSIVELKGSTLLAAFIHKNYLTVAHVGDSRAVICLRNGEAKQVTTDHKPDSDAEKRRIESAGGFVAWNGVWRVAGILATSRALGDAYLKTLQYANTCLRMKCEVTLKKLGYITAEPDVISVDLAVEKPRFIILASDGLWDVINNDEAVNIVKKNLKDRTSSFGAKNLVDLASRRRSADNISVMVINLLKEE